MTALNALAQLIKRYDSFDPATQSVLRRQMSPTIAAADAEFDALCERLSTRRDWLDAHRCDNPPHKQYEKRRAHFFAVDCKAHAEAGELLDRAYALLTMPAEAA